MDNLEVVWGFLFLGRIPLDNRWSVSCYVVYFVKGWKEYCSFLTFSDSIFLAYLSIKVQLLLDLRIFNLVKQYWGGKTLVF